MARKHKEEDDAKRAACTGENGVKVKAKPLWPIYSTGKINHSCSKSNVLFAHDLVVHVENVEANRRHPLHT